MASLSNINGIFDVHSTGAIQFNGNHGTAGQILKSNGNAAPTWVDPSTVIGGPYLPLTGGTLTGATATASGISFTVGGALSAGVTTITSDTGLRVYSSTNAVGANVTFSDVTNRTQLGFIKYFHADTASYGSANAFVITGDQTTMTILADGKLMYKEGIYLKPATGTGAGTRKDNLWDAAYNDKITGLAVTGTTTKTLTATQQDGGTLTATWTDNDSGGTVTGTGANTQVAFWTGTSVIDGSSDLRWDNTNKELGIGRNPDYSLDIYNSSGTTSSTTGTTMQRLWNYVGADLNQQKTFIDFVFQDDNDNEYPQVRIGAEVGQNGDANSLEKEGSGAFVVYTNNATGSTPGTNSLTERMRVDYAGNVGIGTTSPNAKLQVGIDQNSNATGISLCAGASVGNLIARTTTHHNWFPYSDGNNYYSADNHIFRNHTHSTEWMRVNSSGNVGIGTTTPSNKLQIAQGHSILVGDYFQIGSGSSSIMGALGWNRDTTNGVIYNTSFGAFQMHNNQGKLCLQGYNASGVNQFQHEFYNNGNIFFNGEVGIGTTTPGRGLTIDKSNEFASLEIIKNNTGNQIAYLGTGSSGPSDLGILQLKDNNTIAVQIYTGGDSWLNGGNVGIGTTSPAYKLDVAEKIRIVGGMVITATTSNLYATDGALSYYSASNGVYLNGAGASGWLRLNASGVQNDRNSINIYGSAGDYMNFRTANVERLLITSGGTVRAHSRLDVGSTTWTGYANNPAAKLNVEVAGDNAINIYNTQEDYTYLRFIDSQSNGSQYSRIGWSSGTGNPMVINNMGADAFYIAGDGYGGVGMGGAASTGVAGDRLQITGANNGLGCIKAISGAMSYGVRIEGSNLSTQLALYTSSTSQTTQINFEVAGNSSAGKITTTTNTTTYTTSSDYRLKENVVPISDSISRLNQLKPSRFNFIEEPNKTVDGFIAHEVQDIVPEAIVGEKDEVDENGGIIPQGIDQAKLVPLLVAAIQELEARVKELENK